MTSSFQFNKQRGIYSEVLAPEVSSTIGEKLKQGPDKDYLIETNPKANLPKATRITIKAPGSTNDKKDRVVLPQVTEGLYSRQKEELADVEPKVMEPYEAIPSRVPRKVAVDRLKKEFASYRIEDLLLERGVDVNAVKQELEWLALELFDDTTFDDYSNEEWVEKAKDPTGKQKYAPARALVKNGDEFVWKRAYIQSYDSAKGRFSGITPEDGQTIEVSRINVLFDAEDPRQFAQRVAKAHKERCYTDSSIRYNFFIDNMPHADLNELDQEQKRRLENLSKNIKRIRDDTKISESATTSIMEVGQDYSRTMNRIIFDKYLSEAPEELKNLNLTMPPEEVSDGAPPHGMIQVPRDKTSKDFTETFKEFCFAALYIKEEVIKALQEIRVECKKCEDEMVIFDLKGGHSMRMEEFKHIQESAISQIMYHLKGTWVNELSRIIKQEFKDVGKGWFNMKETSKITYDFGKLKKFLTVIRVMMQDTLLSLVKKSYNQFCDFIIHMIPETVEIISVGEVKNTYTHFEYTKSGIQLPKIPLFAMDVFKTSTDDGFFYSTPPQEFVNVVLSIFNKALEDIQKIPDLEPKILQDLYKTQKLEAFIKAPRKPAKRPNPEEENDDVRWVWILDMHENLQSHMRKAIEPLSAYLKQFDAYKDILAMKPDDYTRNIELEENPRPVESLRDEIYRWIDKEKKLRESIPETVHVSCFKINCKDLINNLSNKYMQLIKNLKELIARRAKDGTQSISNQYNLMQNRISKAPKDIEELTQMKEYMAQVPQELDKIKIEMRSVMGVYEIMDNFEYKFTKTDLDKKWKIYGGPKEINTLMTQRNTQLEKDKKKFLEKMVTEQETFKDEVENLEQTIQGFFAHDKIEKYEEIAETVRKVNEILDNFGGQARLFNSREGFFDMSNTDYNQIPSMLKDFQPYSNLWLTVSEWNKNKEQWLNAPFDTIDAVAADKFVEERTRILTNVTKFFKDRDLPKILKIAEKVKAEIDEFKPRVPLLVALRKKGLEERHWQQISDKMNFKVRPAEDSTFQKFLDMQLMNQADAIVEIGERAAKEYNIKVMLDQMNGMWDGIDFKLMPYRNTNSWIIKGYDEIETILDDHIVNIQAMTFSPFKKPFEEEINKKNTQFILMSDILTEWAKVQGQWMYLQPIFDSGDIAKQLPAESKKFKSVDSTWKNIMSQTKTITNVYKVCEIEGLYDKLQEANKSLELIQKELNNYLEKKREIFARFYFLSNDDLLAILSQTKDPEAVQPHLRNVFENIQKLEFDGNKKIHAMYSAEGEKINFVKVLDPTTKNVEYWMGDVEDMMRQSVRDSIIKAVADYTVKPRAQWVVSHPGQCVLNGSQVHWTTEVEAAMKSGGVEGVREYHAGKLTAQLSELVKLVRTKLTKMSQITINALIVIDVHAKDVVEKLVVNQVDDVGAFEWISQLRYYWENDDLYVKCIQTNFPYGYEYLGNTLRLVITPLTDKCYMTLMGALKLNLGGAPAGPAGTGKTESTKDLAKALAKQCVVFNCSDGMNYIMVGKFFKGLASAGAWACFDEFNRINIEVLSVIAQQLLELFGAKAKGTPQIEFEGSNIKVLPTFCVFITMNPGYAGRTELPDNLKALFRPVAMMVPDYALIGEIMLYSFGFETARDLARKMVATFKLSSEQLSSQDHYDYGMRAVRSVINAAGLLKQADPDMNEDQLLLRALRDVNVPKFLKDDLPLFESIIKDLFPGVEKPKVDYGDLLKALQDTCKAQKLQPIQPFIDKIIQLYDTIQVRHGLMLVGPTGGGKTSNYKILQQAMTSLAGKGKFTKVNAHILNPKSITMGQLYGQINEATKEWTDGILAYIVRECCKDETTEKQWVMFDGPVDAIWIESMNTVLDDNKKLCLNSGQILMLTPHMTMMFEVEDLAVASPATVSRCGMVYMEPGALGLQPLIDSWLEELPPNIKKLKGFADRLRKLWAFYLDPTIEFLRKRCRETVTTPNNNIVQSFMRVLNSFFADYRDTEIRRVSSDDMEALNQALEPLFVFSLTWSLACTVDVEGRKKFNTFIRDMMDKNGEKCLFPDSGTIYDFQFSIANKEFTVWTEQAKNFEVDPKLTYSEIVIPTNDYLRMLYMMKLLLSHNYHVLCPGPTGTGKSLNASTLLISGMPEEFQYIPITFSAQTTANQVQDTIDSKMQKRRKGVYGPEPTKRCIIFIDDMNMPKKEQYGAQPPIELVRQYLDHHGWYDRKSLQFQKLEDLILLSAMGPPGGGRTFITNRVIRHYNVISYTELEEDVIRQIFVSILNSFLRKFSEPIRNAIPQLIESVLIVYNTVKAELRPTPSKSHYTFNLRDISKVFQGVCGVSVRHCPELSNMLRLWYHENMRVFHDRLTTEADRTYLKNLLTGEFPKFGLKADEVIDIERVIFGDFMGGRDADPRLYCQINDLSSLLNKMENFQEDYNSDPSFGGGKAGMKLVMFLDACEHIARISRILRQPQGNALLLGVGGSGRQSLARMATFISSYKLFQIEVVKGYNMSRWRDDVKKVLMLAGIENKPITFLFVDTQIINEQMLEDINNILNSGDVTGIYKNEDYDIIYQTCKADCLRKNIQPNKMNMFGQYLVRVRKNIHIVIAMSPLGESFTTRLRMFPSLVNCCTIDWFTEWPEEALIGVGKGQLMDVEQDLGIEHISGKLVEMFKTMHKSVEKKSVSYVQELRRYNYVTPTSYLELLNMFKTVLSAKRTENKNMIQRLKNGLDKLMQANEAVGVMQIELSNMQPELEKASIDTAQMMEKLLVDKKVADEKQKVVLIEEAAATKEAEEANKLAKEAEESVAEANIILARTTEEVKNLKKEHLVEIKTLSSPPIAVRRVLDGVCILMDIAPIWKNIPGQLGKKEEDYFEPAKNVLLASPGELLQKLQDYAIYKKDEITEATTTKLRDRVLSDPDCSKEKVDRANMATKFLYSWMKAMYDYSLVFKQTEPQRKKLAEMKKKLAQSEAELAQKQKELEEVNNTIQKLQEAYEDKIQQKEMLQKKIDECKVKLKRAEKLVTGLSDEYERWKGDIERLTKRGELLSGDSTIAAAMVNYAGPFTSKYRQELESLWVKTLVDLGLPHTAGINMRTYLGDSVKIQAWNIAGLPKDDTSTENGIIIFQTRRWPLMIDPQTQANRFIKQLARDNIDPVKPTDPAMMRSIELAIQFGKWCLLENVGRDLDPALEPVLQQQFVKSGGSWSITIGDKNIPYNENFKFLMTTTLPNPHYPPETFVKVTIINFAITPSGLEEQMLAIIVGLEQPQLEQKKEEIVHKNAEDKKQLQIIEDNILKALSESKGDILMDEGLINNLDHSKKMSSEIAQRVKDSKATEEQIDAARESYRPVAYRSSLLFFAINDLAAIDPMYQYSLQWFSNLFQACVPLAIPSNVLEQRLKNLNDKFTFSLYENVCRSLFEKHKLLFSFLLTAKILQGDKALDDGEWTYLLTGFGGSVNIPPNPTTWISENSWPDVYRQIHGADLLPVLKGLEDHFMKNCDEYKAIFDSTEAHLQPLPEPWETKLEGFQKLIVLKAIRMDKVVNAVQLWVGNVMGKQFIEPPTFDIAKCYVDSSNITPLIFVLSAGSDPVSDFQRFAEEKNMSKRVDSISLGQGQGEKAARMIREAANRGGWVLLQNCHLAETWMPELEKCCEELNQNVHPEFRLWLTSMPASFFPISVLQNSVKMTLEPPQGVRPNLTRTYAVTDDKDLNDSKKPEVFKRLFFGFALFHAIIQDRRKFGAIGWNIPYEFTNEDLNVCKKQLRMLLDEYSDIPFKVLNYVGAEINYGGRVTDDKDVRLITTILKGFICPESLRENYKFSESGVYISINPGTQADYLNYIKGLPLNPEPEIFGLHDNAEITNAQNQTRLLLETLLSSQPRSSAKQGKSREDTIIEIAENIQKRTPPVWDVDDVSKKYPTMYEESMNTVLVQEVIRYNRLLEIMADSLANVKKACKGEVVMSEELELLATGLFINQVPKNWEGKGFLSLKPLASWIVDLNERVDFLNNWIKNGTPVFFWISRFFFPQAFITGTMQNYARKHVIAIDRLAFDFLMLDQYSTQEILDLRQKPEDGCYIYGMYLEGARWDNKKHVLTQSRPKELYTNVPLIHLVPRADRVPPKEGIYNCPIYKVLSRAGTLSTTGHSTNFVMFMEVPSAVTEDVWIKAGVAMFLSLRY